MQEILQILFVQSYTYIRFMRWLSRFGAIQKAAQKVLVSSFFRKELRFARKYGMMEAAFAPRGAAAAGAKIFPGGIPCRAEG